MSRADIRRRKVEAVRAGWAAERSSIRRSSGFVYFLRCERFIKIGYSAEPTSRLREYVTSNPFECVLVATLSGGLDLEAQMHRTFAEWRHRGEWFVLDERSSALLGDIIGQHTPAER